MPGDAIEALTNGRDFPVPDWPHSGGQPRSVTTGSAKPHQLTRKGKPTTILTVGIDLAKNVFALHGVNEAGKPELLRPSVRRGKLNALVAGLPPCVIGIEARSGAHYWARQFAQHGHTVTLIAPTFVTPHRLGGNMRFVPAKTEDQQSRLMVHRAHQGFVQARKATINRIRGLLSKWGIVLPLKANTVRRQAALHLEELPGYVNTVIGDLLSDVTHQDERIAQYDCHIQTMARTETLAQPLMRLMGVGGVSATAIGPW